MSTLSEIDCRSLVRKPWKLGATGPDEFDCWHLWRALMRLCCVDVPEELIGRDYETLGEAMKRVREQAGRFERVGNSVWNATELGDLAETIGSDGVRHASGLISTKAPKKFLTTSARTGSIIVRASAIEHSCIGVWRWVA